MILPRPIYSGLLYAAARQPCSICISVRENSRSTWSIGPSDSGRLTIRRELKEEPDLDTCGFRRRDPSHIFFGRVDP